MTNIVETVIIFTTCVNDSRSQFFVCLHHHAFTIFPWLVVCNVCKCDLWLLCPLWEICCDERQCVIYYNKTEQFVIRKQTSTTAKSRIFCHMMVEGKGKKTSEGHCYVPL